VFAKIFNRHFYPRVARWSVLICLVSVPFLVYGVRGALQGSDTNIRQWLPGGFSETQEYDRFLAQFGSEEMAVVSWPGCTVDDERFERLATALVPYTDAADATAGGAGDAAKPPEHGPTEAGDRRLFKRVLTTRQALDSLQAEPVEATHDEAVRRLSGLLVGPDGKTAAMIVMVNEAGAADRKQAVALLGDLAERAGVSRDDLRMAGPTIESVALDSESKRSRYLLTVLAVLSALLLAWRCLRSPGLIAMVFATAVFSAALNVALVYYLGGTMNVLMGMMPTLTYLLALSGSIHLSNYYREAVAEGPTSEAPLKAVKAAWMPCLLSAFTTAVGLGSMGLSDIGPVRWFGLYSALGVLTALPVLFVVLPSMLQLWPVIERRKTAAQAAVPAAAVHANTVPAATGTRWTASLATWLVLRRRWITVAGFVVMAAGVTGLFKLNMSVKLLNLFSPDARIIQDYAWLEQHLGPMVPIEVVVRFDKNNSLTMLERMQLVDRIERKLDALEKVGGTMSAATFAPNLPTGGGASLTTKRVVLGRKLEQNRDYFRAMHYLHRTDNEELWRISARVEALNSLDYGQFVSDLRREVEPVLDEAEKGKPGSIEAAYTGIVPLVYKAQRTLLEDLGSSFFSSFLLIGAVMAVMLRSVRAGMVSMLPNIFPATVLFGGMGMLGTLCDIGSMMTAGTALGIAVDDTIHYLTCFRRGLAAGMSRTEAIKYAYDHCATAMLQTTIVCGLGFLVFALSSFVPTSRFAWMMAATLLTGVVGDLIWLPALLAGPLGKLFEPKKGAARTISRADLVESVEIEAVGDGIRTPKVERVGDGVVVARGEPVDGEPDRGSVVYESTGATA
jgi:predicted RND superfamily exporter protein